MNKFIFAMLIICSLLFLERHAAVSEILTKKAYEEQRNLDLEYQLKQCRIMYTSGCANE